MPDLANALEVAAAGWHIIPLHGKVPITSHGVNDATTDPAQIREWWAGREHHNIGARVPRSLVVLDVDPQNGGSIDDLEAAAGCPLPPTLTVHSGRGTGGVHLYYNHPGGTLTTTRLPRGIDIKTSTGYCVVPPSVHPATGHAYAWEIHDPAPLPDELLALIRPATRPPRRQHATPERGLQLVRYVEQLAEGNRNAGLYWAACRAAEENAGEDVYDLLEAAATIAGLTDAEAQRTIASARRSGRKRA